MDINRFIDSCYRELLNRQPDSEGFAAYQRLICEGAPKEAVICLIAKSEEFAGRYQLDYFNAYRKAYNKFRQRQFVKSLPLFGYFINLILLPKTIRSSIIENKINEANQRQQMDMLNEKMQILVDKISGKD